MADNSVASDGEATESIGSIDIDDEVSEVTGTEVEVEEAENSELESSNQTSKSSTFKPNWKKTFKWVVLKQGRMYCTSCQEAAARKFRVKDTNAFAHSGSTQLKFISTAAAQMGCD